MIKNKTVSKSIKEDNIRVSFIALHDEIKNKIINGVKDINLCDELNNLHFIWVDLNRTIEKQENELVDQLAKLFDDKIVNHRAAIKSIISLFREIEETYNNGNIAKLLDRSKWVTSQQIEDTLHLLTSKSKCFDYWRSRTQ